MALDILSWILLVAGTAFGIVGGVGLLRLPDLFTRMHAAGLIDTMAIGLIGIGLMLQAGWTIVTIKLLIILALLFFTSPTATHALAKAAIHGGSRPRAGGGGLLRHEPAETVEGALDAAAKKVAKEPARAERGESGDEPA